MPSIRLHSCTFVAGALLAAAVPIGANGATTNAEASRGFERTLRPAVQRAGEAMPAWPLAERMAHYGVPGVAVAILRDGEVVHAAGYGLRQAGTSDAVDADTLFSVGSVSKVLAAGATLRLVAQGKLDLDRDVGTYLRSWKIPPFGSDAAPKVTLRMLLSHTAGFNVHGFEDFPPGAAVPTVLQTLEGESPAKHEPIRLIHPPGERLDYSGGGVTVEQLVLTDATGRDVESIARDAVFEPLRMQRSTFESPLAATRVNVAKAHGADGKPRALPRGWETFPELAASGLWSSANDLAAYVRALIRSYRGEGDFLPRALAREMMTEVAPSEHGLGPRLAGIGETRTFHHGGANDSYRATIEGNLYSGDGLVVLTNGERGDELAEEIARAVADVFDWPTHRPVRTIAVDPDDAQAARYAGTYQFDDAIPQAWQKRLNEAPHELRVTAARGKLSGSWNGKSFELLPVATNRYVAMPSGALRIEFHRDAHGAVSALSLDTAVSRAYYRRRASP
ncbi:serine hydrolase domain-containing protein [Dokdonella sp.]|uniref:serine hydrolase domain-containing protein n=1 Tax=Dokdonella sp. TaxID=2291710 RepID=UPI001B251127|nr:serine hydrolase domain-containing protein [Dokdonella sp.]MBO9664975.1 serine hydrolase [Dokdonella sp.]